MRLYVDATIGVEDARQTVVKVFGPFSDRAEAERALTSFIGRTNALGATIRDPESNTAESVSSWIERIRKRLVEDDDSTADVDLLHGLYCAATGEDVSHPYEDER